MAEVLRVAFPLVMASSGHALRLFADRVMLSHYSREAISASMPAGLGCFVLIAFFLGIAGYTNTFVAQYTGADRKGRVGISVWQGVLLGTLGGLVISVIGLFSKQIFAWVGHAPEIQVAQAQYFQALTWFAFAPIVTASLLSFWSGRGQTWVVMAIELFGAGVNVVLNYALIFGRFGLPQMGIVGAGLATGLSGCVALGLALSLFLRKPHRERFGTWPKRLFDRELMGRLLHFGLPNGIQFSLDMAAFNLFVIFMGKVGPTELEAVTLAFSLNGLAFLPLIGLGATSSILVGQSIGAKDIPHARRAVWSAVRLGMIYMAGMGLLFNLLPHQVLSIFRRPGDVAQVEVLAMAAKCLRYITVYLLFDAFLIVYSGAIKGAGDTRFTMWMGLVLSWGTLVLPCFLLHLVGASIWALWWVFVVHVSLAGTVFYLRYRGGRWQKMRVIEEGAE